MYYKINQNQAGYHQPYRKHNVNWRKNCYESARNIYNFNKSTRLKIKSNMKNPEYYEFFIISIALKVRVKANPTQR